VQDILQPAEGPILLAASVMAFAALTCQSHRADVADESIACLHVGPDSTPLAFLTATLVDLIAPQERAYYLSSCGDDIFQEILLQNRERTAKEKFLEK
jgi:hypothetical protein